MPTASISAAGMASVILASMTRMWGETPPPMIKVTEDGSFLSEWTDTSEDGFSLPPCKFYNATYQYTGALCSHFAVARMSRNIQVEALNRALACAAHFEIDCVLSPEIGLSVPAAFVYDPEDGLRMIIAPKLVDVPLNVNSENRLIEFRDPHGNRHAQMNMQSTVGVEYLKGVTRQIQTEVFENTSAYCVQLLRLAFDASCWKDID
jgi:hypothetical protein